jgi:hypothetical protein
VPDEKAAAGGFPGKHIVPFVLMSLIPFVDVRIDESLLAAQCSTVHGCACHSCSTWPSIQHVKFLAAGADDLANMWCAFDVSEHPWKYPLLVSTGRC